MKNINILVVQELLSEEFVLRNIILGSFTSTGTSPFFKWQALEIWLEFARKLSGWLQFHILYTNEMWEKKENVGGAVISRPPFDIHKER